MHGFNSIMLKDDMVNLLLFIQWHPDWIIRPAVLNTHSCAT